MHSPRAVWQRRDVQPRSCSDCQGGHRQPILPPQHYRAGDPGRDVQGDKAVSEYFLLAGYPGYLLSNGARVSGEVVSGHFQSLLCEDDEVSVIIDNTLNTCDPQVQRNLTQVGVYRFDCCGRRITSFDINILQLEWFEEAPLCNNIDKPTQMYVVCSQEASFCHGSNAQYERRYNPDGTPDITECLGKMATKPLGSLQRGTEDNLRCRLLHSLLLAFDPTAHCPHVGFNSTKCYERDYDDRYSWEFHRESCTFRDRLHCLLGIGGY